MEVLNILLGSREQIVDAENFVTVAEQAVKLAHPNEPRPKRALEALKK